MRTSEDIKEIAKALSAFQAECPNVVKSAFNPFYKSHYADLGSIWDTVRPLLNKHGLSVSQGGASCADKRMKVTTLLMHASGQFIEATLELSAVDVNKEGKERFTPQTGGIAMTYGRRYGLSAMLGIASEEDTDGNGQGHGKPKAETKVTETKGGRETEDQYKANRKLLAKMALPEKKTEEWVEWLEENRGSLEQMQVGRDNLTKLKPKAPQIVPLDAGDNMASTPDIF